MAELKKWFPFKFRRDEKQAESGQSQTGSNVPARTDFPFPAWPLQMSQMMDRMFADPFFASPASMLRDMDRFFGDFAPSRFSPNVDVVDTGKAIEVSAELPGLDKDDIQLSVEQGSLKLEGEKKQESKSEEEGCYRTERYYGRFERVVPLPSDVDTNAAEAKFDKGVLKVVFPKTNGGPQSKKVEIK